MNRINQVFGAECARTADRDTGPIGLAINVIENRLSYLHEELSVLLSAIEPILGIEPPTDVVGNKQGCVSECRMEEVLTIIAGSIEHATHRVVLARQRVKL